MALFGIGLAAVLFSSSAFAQKTPEAKETKKTRHIKMMKIENGKKMELDTVLTGNDVFIWNGDTLNPAKHTKKFNSSGFDKLRHIDVEVEDNDGNENVRIFRHRGGKPGEPMILQTDSDNDVQLFSDMEGDSIQKKIVIHKRLKHGNDEDMYLNGPDMRHFPPMPPMPPAPHMKMLKRAQSGRVIDLNDPNIISYRKKDLSGGREKIEIIRKKSEGLDNMDFNFQFDNDMMVPEPPEPPVFMNELNNDEGDLKVIRKEKKVEEQKDQKIEEETAPKENK
jgi:hypothetical protein